MRGSITVLCFLLSLSLPFDSTALTVCNNRCGPAVDGKFVGIQVKNRALSVFEAQSAYVHQMTVSLAMRNLMAYTTSASASNNGTSFVFETKFYAPYGDMVTSIGGINAGREQYWKLKVNGQESTCGIDTQVLQAGDVVQWTLEEIRSGLHQGQP